MCRVTAVPLFAFVVQAYTEEFVTDHATDELGSVDLFIDELADKLIDNVAGWSLQAWPKNTVDMQDKTLGRPGRPNAIAGSKYDPKMLYNFKRMPSTRPIRYGWQELRHDSKDLGSRQANAVVGGSVRGGRSTAVIAKAATAGAPAPEVVLYGSQGSRSPLVNWALYELGVEFSMGDLNQNPHPFGQIPSIQVGDATLFESGAILAYLQNLFGKEAEKLKAAIISWIVWANASLDPVCFKETPEGKVYDTGLRDPNQRRILKLEEILSKQEYVVSNEFSLADVAIASYLLYVVQFFPDVKLSQWKNVVAYMKRCAERPAYGKAFGDNVQGFLMQKLTQEAERPDEPEKKMFGGLFG